MKLKFLLRYHSWMENEEIRELTASLTLTIDEEYEMQQTWLNDKDKCTFIILSKETFEQTHDEIGNRCFLINFVYLMLTFVFRIHDRRREFIFKRS